MEYAAGHAERAGFNPRPCARGDDSNVLCTQSGTWFQSTPLREGRPVEGAGPGVAE